MKIKFEKSWLYSFLLNIYRFRHCFFSIGKDFGFRDMFGLCFWNLLGKRDDIIYLQNLGIYAKANFFVITTLIEVFNRELYKNLTGLERVLDLGAYIGESAIYLSRYNTSVVAFEPSPEKFHILQKNIADYHNIEAFQYAVVDDSDLKEISFYERDPFDFCSSSKSQKKLTKEVAVPCKDIISIIEKYDFDGLKMDIEGGEFPILEILILQNKFTFQKGIIEFHFTGDDVTKRRTSFGEFYSYLIEHHYQVSLFDNDYNFIDIGSFSESMLCLNLEFKKL